MLQFHHSTSGHPEEKHKKGDFKLGFDFSRDSGTKDTPKLKAITASVNTSIKDDFKAECDARGVRMAHVLRKGLELTLARDEEFLTRLKESKALDETSPVTLSSVSPEEHADVVQLAKDQGFTLSKVVTETIAAFMDWAEENPKDEDGVEEE